DTFTLQNGGRFPHNLHIEGNGVSLDVKPDGPVAAGESFTGAVTLPAGTYDIWCPVGNHRDQGMVGTLTVAGAAAGGAAQVPAALPRTGDADAGPPVAPIASAFGALLIAAGVFVAQRGVHRRRGSRPQASGIAALAVVVLMAGAAAVWLPNPSAAKSSIDAAKAAAVTNGAAASQAAFGPLLGNGTASGPNAPDTAAA